VVDKNVYINNEKDFVAAITSGRLTSSYQISFYIDPPDRQREPREDIAITELLSTSILTTLTNK
jgi:hypothetical protein